MSGSSDGSGGGLGARRAAAQRSARRLGGAFGLDDCDGTVGVEQRRTRKLLRVGGFAVVPKASRLEG